MKRPILAAAVALASPLDAKQAAEVKQLHGGSMAALGKAKGILGIK